MCKTRSGSALRCASGMKRPARSLRISSIVTLVRSRTRAPRFFQSWISVEVQTTSVPLLHIGYLFLGELCVRTL